MRLINRITLIFLSVSFLCCSFKMSGQQIQRCHTFEKMQALYDRNPQYKDKVDQGRLDFIRNKEHHVQSRANVTIPVHVIIVHHTGLGIGVDNNLSSERIQSQIDVLNEDFTATNSNYSTLPSDFAGGNPDIDFCLASVDPNGLITDGITRYPYDGDFENNELIIKNATAWDRDSYLNIWVAPELSLLGWAYIPSAYGLPDSEQELDGVVITTSTFGGPGYATFVPYNLGRTVTHEVGHYLGLEHPWGSGGGGCDRDDGISDTPVQNESNYQCPIHPSPSCNNSGDFFMNYMDYVDDDCMVAFSEEQSSYMNFILNTFRSSLQNSALVACSIGVTNPVRLSVDEIQSPMCFNGNDGSLLMSANGGVSPYIYTLQPSGISNTHGVFNNIEGGNYTVSVVDSNQEEDLISDIFIGEPSQINTNILITEEVSCLGANNGEIFIATAGGNGDYTYIISDHGTFNSSQISNLSAGDYSVTVLDNQMCETVDAFTLTTPDPLNDPNALELLITNIQDVSCLGGNDGMISLSATGGSTSYNYQLNELSTNTGNFQNLSSANYLASVIDDAGCTDTIEFVIADGITLEFTIESQMAICGQTTGSLTILPTSGQAPFTYTLGPTSNTSGVFTELGGGTYDFIIEDSNFCENTGRAIITESSDILITQITPFSPSCIGNGNGGVIVDATGGSGNYELVINDVTYEDLQANNLIAGDYTAMIIDANDCPANFEFSIVDPEPVTLSIIDSEDVTCLSGVDGMVILSANNGSGTYVYELDGMTNTHGVFTDLSSGTYIAKVKDVLSCIDNIEFEIKEGAEIHYTENTTMPLCFGEASGSINLQAISGLAPFTYTIGNVSNSTGLFNNLRSGDYSFVIEDANQCQTSGNTTIANNSSIVVTSIDPYSPACISEQNGGVIINISGGTGSYTLNINENIYTGLEANDLASGSYTASVSDANGCQVEIEFAIEEPIDLELTISDQQDVTCQGGSNGSIALLASGGTGNYQYQINTQTSNTGDFSELSAGIYQAMVTDESECMDMLMFEIKDGRAIEFTSETNDVKCHGQASGAISIQAISGLPPYTYTLGSDSNSTGMFVGLESGQYSIIIEDANQCINRGIVDIEEPSSIEIMNLHTSPTSCPGDSSGSMTLEVAGGTGDYTLIIDDTQYDNLQANDLSGGSYLGRIIDSNSCSIDVPFSITEPEEIEVIEIGQILPSCVGFNDGIIRLEAIGGSGIYTYELDGVSVIDGVFSNLNSGSYTIHVYDSNQCQASIIIDLPNPDELALEVVEIIQPSCFGDQNGAISVKATGGSNVYSYELNDIISSSGMFTNLVADTYTINVNDSNMCASSQTFELKEPLPFLINEVTSTEIQCNDEASSLLMIDVSGGSGEYAYQLNDGEFQSSSVFESLAPDRYLIEVIDANNCVVSDSLTIENIPEIDTVFMHIVSVSNGNNGSIELEAIGGTGNYTYSLDGIEFQPTPIFEVSNGGEYSVFIQDDNACIQQFDIEVGITSSCIGVNAGLVKDFVFTPNPVRQSLTFLFCNSSDQDVTFTVFDDNGRVVLTSTETFLTGLNSESIDIDRLATGIYILQVDSGITISNHRFAKVE